MMGAYNMKLLRILELEDKRQTRKLVVRWKRILLGVVVVSLLHHFFLPDMGEWFWLGLISGIFASIDATERTASMIENEMGKTIAFLRTRLAVYESTQN